MIGKRGLWAPLFFLGLALTAAGSVHASPGLWLASLALVGSAGLLLPSGRRQGLSFAGLAPFAFALWIIATTFIGTGPYSAAGPYHASLLVAGCWLGERIDTRALRAAALALGLFAACLAAWALWQTSALGFSRAQAGFETPATLAATLNFVLLPALVWLAWGPVPRLLPTLLGVLLAAGVLATVSRGGWVALAIGGYCAVALARRAGFAIEPRRAIFMAAVLGLGWAITVLLPYFLGALVLLLAEVGALADLARILVRPDAPTIQTIVSIASSMDRLELYELALRSVPAHPWLGAGYLSYTYFLEAGRSVVPSYGVSEITFFAHNDYLQTVLELGVAGLFLLLAIIWIPLQAAWRITRRRSVEPENLLAAIAAASAIAATATHALVDFPFYIPICLVLFGTAYGVLDRTTAGPLRAAAPQTTTAPRWRRLAALCIGGLLAWVLVTPVVAEASAAFAQRLWQNAEAERAAYWFEVARRFAPRDWRYHWYAGQFWSAQAAVNRNPVAARLADDAFAAGVAANPHAVNNGIARLQTQRALASILPLPAKASDLRAWAEQTLRLAPLNREVRTEYVLVLEHIGARIEAARAAVKMAADWPQDPRAAKIARRLAGHPDRP